MWQILGCTLLCCLSRTVWVYPGLSLLPALFPPAQQGWRAGQGRLPCPVSYPISPDLTSASGCLCCLFKALSVVALSLPFTCFLSLFLLLSLSLALLAFSFLSLYFMCDVFSLFGYPASLSLVHFNHLFLKISGVFFFACV